MGVFIILYNNNSIYSDEKSSVLVDKTKNGKVRPWREKKVANVDYFELLHILEFKKAERVKACAEILEYKQNYETGERNLYKVWFRSEEHTSELQSRGHLVCRLLLEKKKQHVFD